MERKIFDTALLDHIGELAKSFEFAYRHPEQINDAFWTILGNASTCELAWRRAEEDELEDAWEILNEITW